MNSDHLATTFATTFATTLLQEVHTFATSRVFNSLIIKKRNYHGLTDVSAYVPPKTTQSVHQLIKTIYPSVHQVVTKLCLRPVSSFFLGNRFKTRSAVSRTWLNAHAGTTWLFSCFQRQRLTNIYTRMNLFRYLFDGRGCPWT